MAKEKSQPLNKDWFANPRNFAELDEKDSNLKSSQIVVLPVPYDSTTEFKNGARYGPSALLSASQYLELYDQELDMEPYLHGIHTLPELLSHADSPQKMVRRVQSVCQTLANDGKTLCMVGGEHSVTSGAVKAYKSKYPDLSVLHLDAHSDLRDKYSGTKWSHACVGRRVWEMVPIVQVGMRAISAEENSFIKKNKINQFRCVSPVTLDAAAIKKIVSLLSPNVYITVDLDALDPSYMQAVGTPEPGGLQWYETLALFRAVAESKRIVAFDLMELCPPQGPESCAFIAAKMAYKLMAYSMYSQGKRKQVK
ncbi:MAG: agmatinase [Dehalococcoidia bacterium]|nr:agmatinase [Dehalococcoidia bacterium]